jgi:hypothetical protein
MDAGQQGRRAAGTLLASQQASVRRSALLLSVAP